MRRVLFGFLIGAAFASALAWAGVLVVQILFSLPWQVLAVAAACLALILFGAWLSRRPERQAQERRAAALRITRGVREINRRAQTTGGRTR